MRLIGRLPLALSVAMVLFTSLPGAVPGGERSALTALYNSTGGDYWTDRTGWKTPPLDSDGFAMPGTEGSWFGVTVESDTVTRLSLPANNLVGSIPAAIGDLSGLKGLILTDNQLEGSIPASLGSLSKLQLLYSGSNQLSGSIPAELGNLGALQLLDLGSNQLSGAIPAELGNLGNLLWLRLASNQLSGAIPPRLANLTGLLDGESAIGYNALHSADSALTALLDRKDPDWAATQTVAPTHVAATPAGPEAVNLTWSPITYSGDSGGYLIFVSTTPGGSYAFIQQTDNKSAASMLVVGLTPGTPYYFKVQTRTYPHPGNLNTVISPYSTEAGPATIRLPVISGNAGVAGATLSYTDGTVQTAVTDAGGNYSIAVSWNWSGTVTPSLPGHFFIPGSRAYGGVIADQSGQYYTAFSSTSERTALIDLYNATDGDHWSNNDGWKTPPLYVDGFARPGTEGTWGGVTVEDGHVICLSLTKSGLVGSIPASIGNLSRLQKLRLSLNQLSGSIPPELGNLTDLEWLQLDYNQLTGSIPPELGNLSELTHLELRGNQLSGGIPVELGNLKKAQILRLGENRLSGAVPAFLGNLSSLEYLEIQSNQLSGNIPSELGNLTNLGNLRLDSNQLSGCIPPELGNLANLKWLYLASNQLSGGIPPTLGNLSHLLSLFLGSNQISGSIPAELGNLTALYSFDIHSNQLSGSIPAELGNLTNLSYLRLDSNQLAGEIPGQLANLTGLPYGELNIGYNALHSADSALTSFLDLNDPDWAATQTVAPANVAATPAGPGTVNLTWDPIAYSGDSGGYRVLVSTTPGSGYAFFRQTADKTTASMPVTGLNPNTLYYVVIRTRTDPHGEQPNTIDSESSPEASAATLPGTVIVSGSAGAAGAVLSYTDGTAKSATADSGGNYSFTVAYNWSGTVAPKLNGYAFTPASRSYANLTAHQTGQNYSAAAGPGLWLLSPNGGEHWTIGETKRIAWKAVNYTGNVRLVLFGNGVKLGDVASNYPSTGGSFTWTVGRLANGTVVAPGIAFALYLRSQDGTLIDPSDGWFSLIAPSTLKLTSPNGGEKWTSGSSHAITWNRGTCTGTVRLILYRNTTKVGQIVNGIPASAGAYAWTTSLYLGGAAPIGTLYAIRLQSSDGTQIDYSDGPFAIAAPAALVAGHEASGGAAIPQEWIDKAGSEQRLLVCGSGGEGRTALGLRLLGSREPRLGVALADTPDPGLALREIEYRPGNGIWDPEEWRNRIEREIIFAGATAALIEPDEGAVRNGDLNGAGYVRVIQELRERLPGVALICATIASDQVEDPILSFNQTVREYALQTRGALLDQAEIDSWAGDEQCLENEIPVRHPAFRPETNGGKANEEGLKRRAAAMWWMLARLSGWEGPG